MKSYGPSLDLGAYRGLLATRVALEVISICGAEGIGCPSDITKVVKDFRKYASHRPRGKKLNR